MRPRFLIPLALLLPLLFTTCREWTADLVSPIFGDAATTTDATMLAIAQAVSSDALLQTVRELSGEDSVQIDGAKRLIRTRHARQTGQELAETYLQERLNTMGLAPTVGTFGTSGRNIWHRKQGVLAPNEVVILCAHFDSMPADAVAPGADDNATGVATVLEAARILGPYTSARTVMFILFDEEEIKLQGSVAFVSESIAPTDRIVAVINVDMIGWDGDDDRVVEIHSNGQFGSEALADSVSSIRALCGLALTTTIVSPGATASDHAPFWNRGDAAVLLIEEYWGGDFNPYYHSQQDRVDKIDPEFFHHAAALAIATTARFAGLTGAP